MYVRTFVPVTKLFTSKRVIFNMPSAMGACHRCEKLHKFVIRKGRWKLWPRKRGITQKRDWSVLLMLFKGYHRHWTQDTIWTFKCIFLSFTFWTFFCFETMAASPKCLHIFIRFSFLWSLLENCVRHLLIEDFYFFSRKLWNLQVLNNKPKL